MRRKIAVPMLLLLLLCACGADRTSAQTPVIFRTGLTESGGCTFQALVIADYGTYVRKFTLSCLTGADEASLTVEEPDYASGITAVVSGEDASLRFEDTVLGVEEFSSRKISPMAAPYILAQAWEKGYISETGMDGELEQVTYLLGYGQDQLTVITNFRGQIPETVWISDGKNDLVTCEIKEFALNQ